MRLHFGIFKLFMQMRKSWWIIQIYIPAGERVKVSCPSKHKGLVLVAWTELERWPICTKNGRKSVVCRLCTWDGEVLQGTEGSLLDRGVPTLDVFLQEIQELVDDSQLHHAQAAAIWRERQSQAGERGEKHKDTSEWCKLRIQGVFAFTVFMPR